METDDDHSQWPRTYFSLTTLTYFLLISRKILWKNCGKVCIFFLITYSGGNSWCPYNWDVSPKLDLVITFDWWVLLAQICALTTPNTAKCGQIRPITPNTVVWRAYFGRPKIVECGTREKIMQNVAHTCWPWVNRTLQSNQQIKFWCDVPIVVTM